MTAGIGDGSDYEERGDACPGIDMPQYLARIPLLFEPGAWFKYGICHEDIRKYNIPGCGSAESDMSYGLGV